MSDLDLIVPGSLRGSVFKQKGRLWQLGYHTGADFIAPNNTDILSPLDGVFKGYHWNKSFGWYAEVCYKFEGHHYHGFFCHMDTNDKLASLDSGEKVKAGQQIGNIGLTGNTTGYHCHVELRSGNFSWTPANFRDPMILIRQAKKIRATPSKPPVTPKPTTPPVGIPHIADLVALTIIHSNVSGYDARGAKDYNKRFPLLIEEGMKHAPDIWCFNELSNLDVGKPRTALSTMDKLLNPNNMTRTPSGSDGRHIYYNPARVNKVRSGKINASKESLYRGDDKQGTYLDFIKNNVLGSVLTMHLENEDASGNSQVKQFVSITLQWWDKCEKNKIPKANRFVTGDMNSEGKVLNAAQERFDMASMNSRATNTKGASLKTLNKWGVASNGNPIDYILVRKNVDVKQAETLSNPKWMDHALLIMHGYLTK